MDYVLRQHGRATLDFLSSFGGVMGSLLTDQQAALDTAKLNNETLPNDLDERSVEIEAALGKVPAFRAANVIGEWHAEHHARIAAEAFEEIQEDIMPSLDALAEGDTILTPDQDLQVPKYWLYPVHRTTGGWDGHRHMGFIHAELIYRYVVGKNARAPAAGGVAGDIFTERKAFAQEAPRRDYEHIVEIGCSSGFYTMQLAEVFPGAMISAYDISIAQLEQAQRNGNALGRAWSLFQGDAQATGLADESCDLFTSFIILHELPVDVIENILREGFRVLKPGGDLMFGDVAPYHTLDKISEWRTDYHARYGGEPYWRGASTTDMVGLLEDIGFVDAKSYGVAPTNFPWVTHGRKP